MSAQPIPVPLHAAFLSGINLGKRRLKMDQLRSHFEDFGLEEVSTFIASGNVIFSHGDEDARRLEPEIERYLADALGFATHVFVRSFDELTGIAVSKPATEADDEGFNAHVIFMRTPAGAPGRSALAALEGADDRFRIAGHDVLWLRRGGLSESPIPLRDIASALGGGPTTMRNLNTVRRMLAKFAGG